MAVANDAGQAHASVSTPDGAPMHHSLSRQQLEDLAHERELAEKVATMNTMQRFCHRFGFSDTFLSGPKYAKEAYAYYKANPLRFKNEISSGLTVSLVYVPESVAFSFVANVDPIVGLYATFFMGIVTALVGGRPGMVSGAAGAMAVVAVKVMETDGLLPQATLLM